VLGESARGESAFMTGTLAVTAGREEAGPGSPGLWRRGGCGGAGR
jgi:hypothetical protein